ncbi:MAG: hypothetical protein OEY33_02175 [Bdellovibrionales bacterium]|jgi:tRNA threonylcarbamoyladenosine biosynthesis protein TsaB|nr:hypothetical protein [Bdellovibrionales bacterium]
MNYLYIDTTFQINVGILNSNFYWSNLTHVSDKKSSALLHTLIHENLEALDIDVKELAGVFAVAGPGSYTGVRLSEGLAQVFDWQKIPTYSFYHFEVPYLSQIAEEGIFISKAFKGEFFAYQWSGDKNKMNLFPLSDLESFMASNPGPFFTHFEEDLKLNKKIQSTQQLIIDSPARIFEKVKKLNLRQRPFYYRPLDKEFKKQ